MKVLRDPQIISGFLYDEPVDEIPALTHCGEALCCRGHARPAHSHPSFEFLYLSRGACHWEAAGANFHQQMGDLFIAHPHEIHRTGPRRNPENQHLWMGLRLNKLGPDGLRLERALRRDQMRLLPGCQEVEPLLNAIISQIIALRPRRAHVVASLLQAFVSLVAQRLVLERRRGPAVDRPILPYSAAVQKALGYMQKNLDRRLSLPELAAAAMIRSTPQLCTLFRREVGATPANHHVQLRLQAARTALRQPSGTITNVALQFGFSSSQHFSTHFRRAFAQSPRQWQLSPSGPWPSARTSRGRKPIKKRQPSRS